MLNLTSTEQLFQVAQRHHAAGRLGQAEAVYRQILARQPQQVDALHYLGVLTAQLQRHDAGVELIQQAIALQPDNAAMYGNLGHVLRAAGRRQEAIAACRRAVDLDGTLAEAHSNLGLALQETGAVEEAMACYRRALGLNPDLAEVHFNLGNALREAGRLGEAIASFRRAVLLNPQGANFLVNLGNAWRESGNLDEAIACYRRALALQPADVDALQNLGLALTDVGSADEALVCYQQALALNPNLAPAHHEVGRLLKDMGQVSAALVAARQAVALAPENALFHSQLVFTMLLDPQADSGAIGAELAAWNRRHAEPLGAAVAVHANDPAPDRRLRIGYVSADFCFHAVGCNLVPLFQHHDRAAYEIFCYSSVARPDALTQEFGRLAHSFQAVGAETDEQVAARVRNDGIDILVDLGLHSGSGRLGVFASRPAPVQATFAGYPGSTGVRAIDYRISDPYLDPPDQNDALYSERTRRLTASFWCYVPLGDEPPVGALPATTRGYVTFGCLNSFGKINDDLLHLWARVLAATPHSRLKLLADTGSPRRRTLDLMARAGIAPERIEFHARGPRRPYLELYQQIDVGLDSVPYNGHTSSLDSFYMGVPVVTLVGRTVVGRAGLSQLTNLGLTELIADTPEDYCRVATQLAGDLPRLAALRSTLRGRMERSPLMDAPRFARDIEGLYRAMWREWCALELSKP